MIVLWLVVRLLLIVIRCCGFLLIVIWCCGILLIIVIWCCRLLLIIVIWWCGLLLIIVIWCCGILRFIILCWRLVGGICTSSSRRKCSNVIITIKLFCCRNRCNLRHFSPENYLIPTFQPSQHISVMQLICQQLVKCLRLIFFSP